MTEVIKEISRRFVVEIGEMRSAAYGSRAVSWGFHRAFNTLDDAEAYAERISEDNEFVRIIDKGEQ